MPQNALKIRKLRLLREYTQEYMAGKLGISVRTYRSIETGKVSPTLIQMQTIADTLQCSLTDLLLFNPETIQFDALSSEAKKKLFEQLSTAILVEPDIPVTTKIRLQGILSNLLQ